MGADVSELRQYALILRFYFHKSCVRFPIRVKIESVRNTSKSRESLIHSKALRSCCIYVIHACNKRKPFANASHLFTLNRRIRDDRFAICSSVLIVYVW